MRREDDDRREGYRKGRFDGQHAVIARAYGRGGPDPLAAVLREHAADVVALLTGTTPTAHDDEFAAGERP